jgi:hypothetical protein
LPKLSDRWRTLNHGQAKAGGPKGNQTNHLPTPSPQKVSNFVSAFPVVISRKLFIINILLRIIEDLSAKWQTEIPSKSGHLWPQNRPFCSLFDMKMLFLAPQKLRPLMK